MDQLMNGKKKVKLTDFVWQWHFKCVEGENFSSNPQDFAIRSESPPTAENSSAGPNGRIEVDFGKLLDSATQFAPLPGPVKDVIKNIVTGRNVKFDVSQSIVFEPAGSLKKQIVTFNAEVKRVVSGQIGGFSAAVGTHVAKIGYRVELGCKCKQESDGSYKYDWYALLLDGTTRHATARAGAIEWIAPTQAIIGRAFHEKNYQTLLDMSAWQPGNQGSSPPGIPMETQSPAGQ